jgi:hypothetical protein
MRQDDDGKATSLDDRRAVRVRARESQYVLSHCEHLALQERRGVEEDLAEDVSLER